jgi:hypothetical protein
MKRHVLGAVASAALLLAGNAFAAPPVTAGSQQVTVTQTPTVTASSAYASGNAVGGLLTFSLATQGAGTGLIQGTWLNLKSAQTATTWLLLFSANPSSTTVTDKTAFSLNAADYDKWIGTIVISQCFTAGTPSLCQAMGGAVPIKIPLGTTLYGVLVTQGTPTFASTSDVKVNLQIIQDLN